jgi:hypothetical protein
MKTRTVRPALADGARILSSKQPWAWALASGPKRVENRTGTTRYRGAVYIHASSTFDRAAAESLSREMRLAPPGHLPQSAVVAVADLCAIVTLREAARFGKWFFGPFGFVLTNVKRPVPAKGRLGLSRVPASLRRRVEKAATPKRKIWK